MLPLRNKRTGCKFNKVQGRQQSSVKYQRIPGEDCSLPFQKVKKIILFIDSTEIPNLTLLLLSQLREVILPPKRAGTLDPTPPDSFKTAQHSPHVSGVL